MTLEQKKLAVIKRMTNSFPTWNIEKLVNENFDWIVKSYEGIQPKKIAEIISTLA